MLYASDWSNHFVYDLSAVRNGNIQSPITNP